VKPGRLRDAEHFVQPRAAEVAVDQRDSVTGLSEHDGKVRRGRRLAFSGERTGELDDSNGPVEPEELQVGSQSPVRLHGVVRRLAQRDRQVVGGGSMGTTDSTGRPVASSRSSSNRILSSRWSIRNAAPRPIKQADDGGEQRSTCGCGFHRRDREERRLDDGGATGAQCCIDAELIERRAEAGQLRDERRPAGIVLGERIELRLQVVDGDLHLVDRAEQLTDRLLSADLDVRLRVGVRQRLSVGGVGVAHRNRDHIGRPPT
jgi:hypothetical protein